MIAASAGRDQVVRLLIGRGANTNAQNTGGHSALQYAASKNHHEVSHMHVAKNYSRPSVDKYVQNITLKTFFICKEIFIWPY